MPACILEARNQVGVLGALFELVRATVAEVATPWWIDQRRRLPADRGQASLLRPIEPWHGAQ